MSGPCPRGRTVIGTAATTDGRQGWRLILATLRDQRRGIAVGVAVGLVWTAAKVTVPLLVQQAVDQGISSGDAAAIRNWAILVGVAGLVAAAFTGLRRYFAFRESRLVEARLRQKIFAHTQRLHFAYHDRVQTGELLSRANTDLQQIQAMVVLIPLTISNAVTVLSVAVILMVMDPTLAVLALGSLPLLNVLGKRFSTRLHPEVMAIQRESAQLASVVEESVSGVRVIRGFGAEQVFEDRLSTEADDLYDASMSAARVRARFLPAMELLPNVGLIAVLGFGGHQVLSGALTLGQLLAFNVYIVLLVWPLRMLGMIIAQAQRAAASAERVHEVLAAEAHIAEPADPTPLPRTDRNGDSPTPPVVAAGKGAGTEVGGIDAGHAGLGEVVFDGVRFGYLSGQVPVLDGFDLRLAPGESVALVGSTGSGKSTVARLLARFYDVDHGAVRIDGVDVRDLALGELRRAVGIVFEDTFLFSDSIAANIAFAQPDATVEQIRRAARLAGADEFVAALPDGYDTLVGERGFSLSGGQRQRLAIARAVLSDPRVLILDDATSAVDPTKEHEIRDAMGEVMAGRTTLVIAHRPATVALADRVVLLDGGRAAATGTHEELLATNAVYRQVLASPLAGEGAAT
ncbi:MAG: ABC transporter ATP-binding protein [Acidimicrobiia bacterium]|nr:ABC transporter ATP-binding protein [Acidimicrobiia bacterium]